MEQVLDEALDLATSTTGALRGYLALYDPAVPDSPKWWTARSLSDEALDAIRAAISSGIVATALAENTVVRTASAVLDPRFRSRESVRQHKIESVICAPIGGGTGVMYLQGQEAGRPFSDDDAALVERFRQAMGVKMSHLLAGLGTSAPDPTRVWREGGRFAGLVGRSAALARCFNLATQFASLDAHVLLTGATGTGKTALAREIHAISPRATAPFVEINCAAIPGELLESELFGAGRGAHSTADRPSLGKVGAADGGTLFLDEIGELTLGAQAKLLQFVQDRTYYALGSHVPRRADVRIIAASNRDLEREVELGRYRSDLFHRLDVLRISMPPLGARPEDLPALVDALSRRHARAIGTSYLGVSSSALDAIRDRRWPGNIRELSNTLQRAVVMAGGIRPLQLDDLDPDASALTEVADPGLLTWAEAMRRAQRLHLRAALDYHQGNVSATARALGITRAHVYNLMNSLGVTRHASS